MATVTKQWDKNKWWIPEELSSDSNNAYFLQLSSRNDVLPYSCRPNAVNANTPTNVTK